jgi:hypothetical protein
LALVAITGPATVPTPSLQWLKPEYLAISAHTGIQSYHAGNSNPAESHDHRLIASEKEHDAQDKFICIYGHRGVSLLRAGD